MASPSSPVQEPLVRKQSIKHGVGPISTAEERKKMEQKPVLSLTSVTFVEVVELRRLLRGEWEAQELRGSGHAEVRNEETESRWSEAAARRRDFMSEETEKNVS